MKGKKPFVIAELGTAHGSSLAKARELIDAAQEAGADCVKFQIVFAREILHPATGIVPLPGGDVRLYDVFKKLEADFDFFAALKTYCSEKKVEFLATPFGFESAALLKRLEPRFVKTASPELNYVQLIEEIAKWNIPAFVSTGVSTLSDIENALFIFDKVSRGNIANAGRSNVTLLHCVTSYPAPPSDYNLRLLPLLRGIFGVDTGVSDHSLDAELVPSVAAALGASVIEKHFCLSREDSGLDDPIALPPALFKRMTGAVLEISSMGPEKALDFIERKYGGSAVSEVLGDGIKRLSPSEAGNYGRTNRSVHALKDIAIGETLTKENTAILRTEKVLRPGIPPVFWETILGKKAQSAIPSGEGVRFADITCSLSDIE